MKKISLIMLMVSSLLFSCKKEVVEPRSANKSASVEEGEIIVESGNENIEGGTESDTSVLFVKLPFDGIPEGHEYFVIKNGVDTIYRTEDFTNSGGLVNLRKYITHSIDSENIYTFCVNFYTSSTTSIFFIDLDGSWGTGQETYARRNFTNQCMNNQTEW